jgi:hypothetical protein
VAKLAVSLVVAAALAASASAASTPNVTGTLTVPRSTYCTTDEPCDPPAVDATLVFVRSGRVVARARANAMGRFSLHLAAGRYAIRVKPTPVRGKLTPATVLVPAARSTTLRLRIAV